MKMWDFVKLELPSEYATSLLECDVLDFEGRHSEKSGEVKKHFKKAVYPMGNKHPLLIFTIKGQYVEVKCSLHKYWHDGENHSNWVSIKFITWSYCDWVLILVIMAFV